MKLKFVNAVLFFLIILTGCSIKETVKNTSDQEILTERAAAYWGHMCRQEFDKAYDFEYPLYKKTVSLVEYIRRFRPNVTWNNPVIENVRIEDGTASMEVKVETDIKMTTPKAAKRIEARPVAVINEKWIKVDGVWYHVPKKFAQKVDKEV